MEILNAIALTRAGRKHPQVRGWLEAWHKVAQAADWRSLMDVRKTYPATDGVLLGKGKNRLIMTVFNAGGNDFRLLTRISYEQGVLQVEDVLTHAEYSKDKWKRRYE